MAEVNLATLPEPESKSDSTTKSTKQDSFASSFYAWKRKHQQNKVFPKGHLIYLIMKRRKIALKKKNK